MDPRWVFSFVWLAALAIPASRAQDVKPFTFVQISDTHISTLESAASHDTNLKAAIAEMNAASPRPAFIIHTGDITEMGQEQQFARYEDDVKAAVMPIHYSPGNHETRWADQSINRFVQHFGSPNVSFKVNGVRFIGFNAAIWLEHHGAVSGDTRRWIVSQLKLDPRGTPAVLFCHQPPMYPDNVFMTGDVELWDAIKPYNVRMFLNGHGHAFRKWWVNGILCRMTTAMMSDKPGYSIYEVGKDDIKVYEKLLGQTPKLVATVPLQEKPVGLKFSLSGRAVAFGENGLWVADLRVEPNGHTIQRVEYGLDHHERPNDQYWKRIDPIGLNHYRAEIPDDGFSPGRHTIAARAVDGDGGVWIESVTISSPYWSPEPLRFGAGTALQGPAASDVRAVYVGGWDGKLYAIDRKTMKKRWVFSTSGAIITRPDVDNTGVYFGSTDTKIYAVDKSTGKQRWAVKTGGPIQAHVLVADGTVFAGSGDHNFYAVDARSGAVKWKLAMGMHVQAKPAYWNGTLYVGAWDNTFYAIEARTGSILWKKPVGGTVINFAPAICSPCVWDGKVVFTTAIPASDKTDSNVVCLDGKTGSQIWGIRLASGSSSYCSPTTDGVRVYLCTLDGLLYALNLSDGTMAWQSQMDEIAYDCQPVYHNGQVICNTLMGSVEAVDAVAGKKLWQYKTGAGLTFAWPTVANETVYQPSMDGTLTASNIPNRN